MSKLTIDDIYNEYGVYTHHFIFGVVGRLTNALLDAHKQGFPLPSTEEKINDSPSSYEEFIRMKNIGMPEPVIRAHILSAGLDPSIVLSNSEPTQQEVPVTFLQELQKGINLKTVEDRTAINHITDPEFANKLRARYEASEDAERIEEVAKALNEWELQMSQKKYPETNDFKSRLYEKFKKANTGTN